MLKEAKMQISQILHGMKVAAMSSLVVLYKKTSGTSLQAEMLVPAFT